MSDEVKLDTRLETEEELKVYELGFHIAPTVSEESLAGEVQKIKEVISSNKGTFVSEDFPKLRTLAYTIVKDVGGKKIRSDRVYFGWVKFIMHPSKLESLKKVIEFNTNILRFLLIKTVKESTVYSGRHFAAKGESTPIQTPKKIQKEELTATTMAEIDKSIEELIIE